MNSIEANSITCYPIAHSNSFNFLSLSFFLLFFGILWGRLNFDLSAFKLFCVFFFCCGIFFFESSPSLPAKHLNRFFPCLAFLLLSLSGHENLKDSSRISYGFFFSASIVAKGLWRERHVNRLARKQRNTLVACLFAELPIGKQIHSIWSAAHWKPPERTYMYISSPTRISHPCETNQMWQRLRY